LVEESAEFLDFVWGELVAVLVEEVDEGGGGVAVEDAGEEGAGLGTDDGVSGDTGVIEEGAVAGGFGFDGALLDETGEEGAAGAVVDAALLGDGLNDGGGGEPVIGVVPEDAHEVPFGIGDGGGWGGFRHGLGLGMT